MGKSKKKRMPAWGGPRQPERVPGISSVRPDTSDTAQAALLPELAR